MLLGQLYFYDKELGKLQDNLQNFSNIEVLGIDTKSFKRADIDLLRSDIINDFIPAIESIFKQENYKFNTIFWAYLKSVYRGSEKPVAATDFQISVIDWVDNDYSSESFQSILDSGLLLTDEADFALYYALKFLHKIIDFDNFAQIVEQYFDREKGANLSSEPQILVVTTPAYYPLYKNINVEFLFSDTDKQILLEQVKEVIKKKPISLMLLDSEDLDLLEYMQRKLKQELVVSTFSMKGGGDIGFFDKIVKDTLGVRLV